MSTFAPIELPGEAIPLTEDNLLRTLQAAGSSFPNQIQSGTKQLQQWEKTPGFYRFLQTAFLRPDVPVNHRYLAVIQLKNGIDKYWRKTAANAVSKEDKAVIRSRLISSGVEEQEQRLALQNALVIAKIVRFEYPQDWPSAINDTLDAIRASVSDSTTPRLERSLLILLYIIKELSTARIQRSRTNLQAATPEILAVLGSIYVAKVDEWRHALQNRTEDPRLHATISQSLLSLKIIRRLIIAGYEHPHRNADVQHFWELSLHHLQAFIDINDTEPQLTEQVGPETTRLVLRHPLQISKFHLEMAEKHPAAFVLLPSSLPLVHAYWSTTRAFSAVYSASSGDEDEGPSVSEKISLTGLQMIRACVRMAFKPVNTFRYRNAEEKEERKQAESTIKQDLLIQHFVEDVMTVIMTNFLVLRRSDLNAWADEPEEWALRQENESEDMNLSVRACSERLVLDLCTHFKSILTQPILGLFHSVANPQNEKILFKEAVYAAIGMSAAIFRDEIDFGALLTSTLAVEVQKQVPMANVLRRRIAILVGQWVVVKVPQESRHVVYQLFDHLLDRSDTSNDLVVRITAGNEFKNVIDDFEFDAQQFVPFAHSIIEKLMRLIEEVESSATKFRLLDTISALIERFEYRIDPFADRIVSMLPLLWEQSGEEHMMKQSILTVLSRLVQALRQASGRFHAMLIPIIQNAVQSDSEMQIYLLEEAMDLWRSILLQTPAPISPEALTLVEHLFPFFDLASESLRAALEITESYVLLAPQEMLSDTIRRPLMTKLTSLIGPKARAESNGMVCNCVELMIRSAANLGGEDAIKQFTNDLIENNFLPTLLSGLRNAWVAHCTTGPLARTPAVEAVVETDYFSILARILLCSPSTFVHAVSVPITASPDDKILPPPSENLKWLLEEWFSHLESIGDPRKRKLMALALTQLLQTGSPLALAQLQLLMTLWTDVVTELCEPDPAQPNVPVGTSGKDSLVYDDSSALGLGSDADAPPEPEEERRRALAWQDPVHRLGLPWVVRSVMAETVAGCGGEQAFQDAWLVNVDRDVVAAFAKLGVMG